jgi:hypothetical protein
MAACPAMNVPERDPLIVRNILTRIIAGAGSGAAAASGMDPSRFFSIRFFGISIGIVHLP